jgi:P27 family predicted phage terminase small subunit
MPGPPPKPATARSRQPRGAALRMLQPLEGGRRTPPAPKGLSKLLEQAWAVFWSSPLAAHTTEADFVALLRLFRLYQQREHYDQIGSEEPLVQGSTKQMILNPLLKELDSLDTKILALEDRFGLSPRARLQLQVTLGDAADGLKKLNAALRDAEEPEEAAEEPDIRLLAVGDAPLGESPAAHRRPTAAHIRPSGRQVHRAGSGPR